MQDTLLLREARIDELAAIAEHWIAMFEEIGNLHESEFVPEWRQRFVRRISDEITRGDAAYFVAADAQRIVGTAGARMMDSYPSEIHGVRSGYIFGVHVDAAYRGRGIATRLTQAGIAFLQERKAWSIRLHASPYGRPIYEKLGFRPANEMVLHPNTSTK
jgi:ribosomal protein S18 acetylase RimI-like enzyme